MQKSFEIEQGVPGICGFKRLEMILLHETKKEGKIPLCCVCNLEVDTIYYLCKQDATWLKKSTHAYYFLNEELP